MLSKDKYVLFVPAALIMGVNGRDVGYSSLASCIVFQLTRVRVNAANGLIAGKHREKKNTTSSVKRALRVHVHDD